MINLTVSNFTKDVQKVLTNYEKKNGANHKYTIIVGQDGMWPVLAKEGIYYIPIITRDVNGIVSGMSIIYATSLYNIGSRLKAAGCKKINLFRDLDDFILQIDINSVTENIKMDYSGEEKPPLITVDEHTEKVEAPCFWKLVKKMNCYPSAKIKSVKYLDDHSFEATLTYSKMCLSIRP
jgi:hypothetical protein